MKRIMQSTLITCGLVLALATPGLASAKKLQIVTTTPDPGSLAEAIGGNRVRVTSLAKGYQDPHFLEAKPSYMLALNKADLVIYIGLDLEIAYLPSLLQGARNAKIQTGKVGHLDLSSSITSMGGTGGVVDRSRGDLHPKGNPHYWLDPENARAMARAIAARLIEIDPDGKETYETNLAAFEKKLDSKEAEWKQRMAPLANMPIITYHTSWDYFVGRYQIDVVGHIEPKPGVPPSPAHTLELIKTARAKNASVILMETFYDERVPELVASKSNARVVSVPNSVGGDEESGDYFALMDHITKSLISAHEAAKTASN